jgi:hypothetical protein
MQLIQWIIYIEGKSQVITALLSGDREMAEKLLSAQADVHKGELLILAPVGAPVASSTAVTSMPPVTKLD